MNRVDKPSAAVIAAAIAPHVAAIPARSLDALRRHDLYLEDLGPVEPAIERIIEMRDGPLDWGSYQALCKIDGCLSVLVAVQRAAFLVGVEYALHHGTDAIRNAPRVDFESEA